MSLPGPHAILWLCHVSPSGVNSPKGVVPSLIAQRLSSWWAALSRLQWPAEGEALVTGTREKPPQTFRRKRVSVNIHTLTLLLPILLALPWVVFI